MNKSAKIWFVTGASKGVGQRLVRQLLARGDCVAATSRTVASLTEAIGPASEQFLPLQVDLTNDQSVRIRYRANHRDVRQDRCGRQ